MEERICQGCGGTIEGEFKMDKIPPYNVRGHPYSSLVKRDVWVYYHPECYEKREKSNVHVEVKWKLSTFLGMLSRLKHGT